MLYHHTHITYCTNIHGGESWAEHFAQLQHNLPKIKASVSPDQPFGLGLRLSAQACKELLDESNLNKFKQWLHQEDIYVFTMNGFPYGDFHLKRVKENVHAPDWTTSERLIYTQNLFTLLEKLLPEGIEGGISTSPLSYRFWHQEHTAEWNSMMHVATNHVVQIAGQLHGIYSNTGKLMHLDIEPEPDGVLENGEEFIHWYIEHLLPAGVAYFQEKYQYDSERAEQVIRQHIQLCYDVCHAAVEFEDHQQLVDALKSNQIQIGKFQISSALKIKLNEDGDSREQKRAVINEFNEQIYLHQVVAKHKNGHLSKYRDLDEALPYFHDLDVEEWRSHFHVPIFLANYGTIESTQQDILDVLSIHRKDLLTNHIEIETYTWNVLPTQMQVPIDESIIREIEWLLPNL